MRTDEKLWWVVGMFLIAWGMVVISLWFVYQGEFEGYYRGGDSVCASYSWQIDEKAFEYEVGEWEYIVENNLHIPKKEEKREGVPF